MNPFQDLVPNKATNSSSVSMKSGAGNNPFGDLIPGNKSVSRVTSSNVSQETPAPAPTSFGSKVGNFVKGLVSAPLTMLARPVQAVAELAGTAFGDKNIDDQVNNISNKISGGFIAKTPQNFGDVKKDVGRGIETVALGAGGPVTAGAGLGFGNSLEQGNDVFSVPTAIQTVLGAAGGKVLDLLGKPLLDAAGKVIGKIDAPYLTKLATQGSKAIEDFASNHNIIPEGISKSVNNISDKAGQYADVAGNKIKSVFGPSEETKIANLQERISPKPTVKEARLAQSQGRLEKGAQPTAFRSGTPDKVLPTDEIIRSSNTINKNIPNHQDLTDPELYSALHNKTAKIATELKPEMQKVPVTEDTVQKITDNWNSLKKTQIENAPATEEANVAKRQAKFETHLQKSSSKNMDDIWQTRIEYDKTIAPNVKKANINSPESLQMQKQEWLQNRKILNDAIKESSTKLGPKAQKSFSDMSDMYLAKENLNSKAKIQTSGQPSKIVQFAKKHPYITGVGITGAVSATGIPRKAFQFATGGD